MRAHACGLGLVAAACSGHGPAGSEPGPRAAPSAGTAAVARDTAVEITLARGLPAEDSARAQVYRLLRTYDLRPWLFTRQLRIERGAIPHSHPVLTLNTRYLDHDVGQLSAFIHEQLHWYVDDRRPAAAAAIAALEARYPEAPVGTDQGGQSRASTYEHLIVCYYELEGLTRLLGEDAARRELAGKRHYRWIYARVLEETTELGALFTRAGFRPPAG